MPELLDSIHLFITFGGFLNSSEELFIKPQNYNKSHL